MRLSWILLACLISACGTESTKLPLDDGGAGDASLDSSTECTCDEVGPCCDGCDVIGLGEECASECSSAATCQADGTCAGEADACDHLVTEPQCQAVTCDEVLGCGAVESIRQGLTCDDGDAQTYGDRCDAGACVGTACECSGETECCDGCHAKNEGLSCSEPIGGTYGSASCEAGQCVGEPCECTEGPCCDGCFFRPAEYQCITDGLIKTRCSTNPVLCETAGTRRTAFGHRWCSGSSAECDGAFQELSETGACCEEGAEVCVDDGQQLPTSAECVAL